MWKCNLHQEQRAHVFVRKTSKICLQEGRRGNVINTKTMKHEIEQELDRDDDNPYKKVILNKVYKEEDKTLQIENWSI